jgi:hypothetical protein
LPFSKSSNIDVTPVFLEYLNGPSKVMSSGLSHSLHLNKPGAASSKEKESTPGGRAEVRWKTVASAPGLTTAMIIAGRLKAEGLPVHAWQEGAGQAMGLTVGILGTAHVAVPEEYVDKALTILNDVEEDEAD